MKKTSPHRSVLNIVAILAATSSFLWSQSRPISQSYYVPFPEADQLTAYRAISTASTDPMNVILTIASIADGTVIYYDHWEDGYEEDITNPKQSTTEVWGDGDPSNGFPPGNPSDIITSGTRIDLRNFVNSTDGANVIKYDGRDKIVSYKPIAITKMTYPLSTGTLLAGSLELLDTDHWGVEYIVPVGEDMPTSKATSTLTYDYDIFAYTSATIMAGFPGTEVRVDNALVATLNEGESYYAEHLKVGARIVASKPVQVSIFTGRPGSTYQSRGASLLPVERWEANYYTPVSTSGGTSSAPNYRTSVFLYNPDQSNLTVTYEWLETRSGSSPARTQQGTITVPALGNARVALDPDGTSAGNNYVKRGAYRFYTGNQKNFYAFTAIDANNSTVTNNQAYDGGFALVSASRLTSQVLVGLGVGRDPTSATNPTENGNPIWITTAGNGLSPVTVYVDYNGDNEGPYTDPNNNRYDVSYDLRELQQQKLYDPDGDQSGMLIYTLSPNVKIAAAWAQDPLNATAAAPGVDVSALIPPVPEIDGAKGSRLVVDVDGDGFLNVGDTLEYVLHVISSTRSSTMGPFRAADTLPAGVSYVPGSTRYRYQVKGAWEAWQSVPDNNGFPLAGDGLAISGTVGSGQVLEVSFRARVDENPAQADLINNGTITWAGETVPVQVRDVIYGSVGDRVWHDVNGDGLQNANEPGLNGVIVYLDLNKNGFWDPGEPSTTTSGDGHYRFGGLLEGEYTVRVDPVSLAQLDPKFGPTWDLDGIDTSYAATVYVGTAQNRDDVDFGFRTHASLGDRVWLDRNGDGVQDPGEPGMNGVRVYIDANNNGQWDPGEPNVITSGDGEYYLGNLAPDENYLVRVDTATLPGGANPTYDLDGGHDSKANVPVVGMTHNPDADFGYRGSLHIGDLVWEDKNGNGIHDGHWQGGTSYQVKEGLLYNEAGTAKISTGNDKKNWIDGVRVREGRIDFDNNQRYRNGIFLGKPVINGYIDFNEDGKVQNASDAGILNYGGTWIVELGIPNVLVYVDVNGNGQHDPHEPSDMTDANGKYHIGNLTDGTYTVRVDPSTLPASFEQTYDLSHPYTDHTARAALGGKNRDDFDFGYRNSGSIGDYVWNDRNGNGVRDGNETGIPGVFIYLDLNDNGRLDPMTEPYAITDANGYYQITNLAAGSYVVRVETSTLPLGLTQTYDLTSPTTDGKANRTLTFDPQAPDSPNWHAHDVNFGYRGTSSFGDTVWQDDNGNGVQEAGELGINGVRVYIDSNGNGQYDLGEAFEMTNATGNYSFTGMAAGNYTVRVDPATLPANVTQTYDLNGPLDHSASFPLANDQNRTDIDFGYAPKATLGDFVWDDLNGNGVQDHGEPGIPGVKVTAYRESDNIEMGHATTGPDGKYQIDLIPGTYYLVFEAPHGYLGTLQSQGNSATDSNPDRDTGKTENITLVSGQNDLTIDAGYYRWGGISGFVWEDTDGDGVGDEPISGVELMLVDGRGEAVLDENNHPITTTTGVDGSYHFSELKPGEYGVRQSQPSGYFSVSDKDGGDPDYIGSNAVITVVSGQTSLGNDFIEERPGALSGFVLADTTGDNQGDSPLVGVTLALVDASGQPVLDENKDPVTTETNGDGYYEFAGLKPGRYGVKETQPAGYLSVSDKDGGDLDHIGDVQAIVVEAGKTTTGNDFIERQSGGIRGTVWEDSDGDGVGDTPLKDVILTLVDAEGNPVLDDNHEPVTTSTDENGNYSFPDLPPGTYGVKETQPAGYVSVSDKDGGDPDHIGDVEIIEVMPGQVNTGNDFTETKVGGIRGHVYVDTSGNQDLSGLEGVILTLVDEHGDPVLDEHGDPVTTLTDIHGSYAFLGLTPGRYGVKETQPEDYFSISDKDGGDLDHIGDQAAIVVVAGQINDGNDFVEMVRHCSRTWAEWLKDHPGETAGGNPDNDRYDNLAEFAFSMEAGTGARDAWLIRPSDTNPGTIEGIFVRPIQATEDVTYRLSYAPELGNPTVWKTIEITPDMITVIPNGDCTETVVIHDLEQATGMTNGKGFVKVCADLDADHDEEVDYTTCVEVEGWEETKLGICCRTYNDPFLHQTLFTGVVDDVDGQSLLLTGSAGDFDLGDLLEPGASHYVEVTSGLNEGHRFDVVSGQNDTLLLAYDNDLFSGQSPYNTLRGALPASLAGASIVLRKHRTLGEIFPAGAFTGTDDVETADQVQLYTNGAWVTYWLYDNGAEAPYWVETGDSSYADKGGVVIAPGMGMFFDNRHAEQRVLAIGEVRENDFVRPLEPGPNLVAGGYPVDQSAAGVNGRSMSVSNGFSGTRDHSSADTFNTWIGDSDDNATGYHSYFLNRNQAGSKWVQTGDAQLTPHDADILFLGDRSVFIKSSKGLESYRMPAPWAP